MYFFMWIWDCTYLSSLCVGVFAAADIWWCSFCRLKRYCSVRVVCGGWGLMAIWNSGYVRRHRPILSLTVTGRARLQSRPTAYFVFTSLHAFQRRCHASKHWSNSFSNSPFSTVVTMLRICCEICHSVALSKPYFCLFWNKNNLYAVNSGEWFGFSKADVCCGPESDCREGCLGRRIILVYNPLFFSVIFHVCHSEVVNTYINIQWCISQTQHNFIMFITVLRQHVSILIESSSVPSKKQILT